MALEAMSSGCACVLSDTGAEYVKHEENSLVYTVGDAQACAEGVSRLLTDVNLFIKLVLGGYKTAEQTYNHATYIDNLEKVIQHVGR